MAAFLFTLSVNKAHSLTTVENLPQKPRIGSKKFVFNFVIHKVTILQSAGDPCLWWTSHAAIQEDLSGQSLRSRQLSVLKISRKSVPPGDLRIEYSKLVFFCFADFFFADRFEDEIDSSRRDFRFSTGEEDVRGSSYRRFSTELLLFV